MAVPRQTRDEKVGGRGLRDNGQTRPRTLSAVSRPWLLGWAGIVG